MSRGAVLAVMMALFAVPTVSAQIIAPPMQRGTVELGIAYKWFDRDIETGPLDQAQWETATFYGRFAAFDWLTIMAEGASWTITHEDFPGQEYSRWTVGGGAIARVYASGRWTVDATASYNEVYDHDNSDYLFDKRTRGWNAGVLLDYSLPFGGQTIDMWAGPMYVDDLIENYPYGAEDPVESVPEANWGAALGANTVFFKHASAFGYVLLLDHPQAAIGVALRMDGSDE